MYNFLFEHLFPVSFNMLYFCFHLPKIFPNFPCFLFWFISYLGIGCIISVYDFLKFYYVIDFISLFGEYTLYDFSSFKFYGLVYSLFWRMFHVCPLKIWYVILLGGMFGRSLLNLDCLWCGLNLLLPCWSSVMSIESEIFKSPTIIVQLSILKHVF